MEVRYHHAARREFNTLPSAAEKVAMRRVCDLLAQEGDQLGAPYSTNVEGADRIRELRPRAGQSAWRAFYRRIGERMHVGAIGPEADANRPGFRRAVRLAEERLNRVERGEEW